MNENVELQKIAKKILSKVSNNKEEEFGCVLTILMIISLVLTLIRIIQECNKDKMSLFNSKEDQCAFFNDQIKTLSLKNSWFTRRTIKKLIKKELTTEEYNAYGSSLMKAILETGQNLNQQETLTLMEAANV